MGFSFTAKRLTAALLRRPGAVARSRTRANYEGGEDVWLYRAQRSNSAANMRLLVGEIAAGLSLPRIVVAGLELDGSGSHLRQL